MKEITNDPQQIAACGLYCGACKKFLDGKGKTDDDEKEMRIPAGRTSFSLNLNKQVTNCKNFFQKFGT